MIEGGRGGGGEGGRGREGGERRGEGKSGEREGEREKGWEGTSHYLIPWNHKSGLFQPVASFPAGERGKGQMWAA